MRRVPCNRRPGSSVCPGMSTSLPLPAGHTAHGLRTARLPLALATIALTLAACSVGSPRPSPSPGGGTPTPPDALGPLSIDQVLADQLALDGRRILVRAGYYSQGGAGQSLVSGYLESYPPQPMLPLLLVGDVPPDVLARLETTAGKPGFALVVWGEVEAIGVFHAERGPAAAWFALESIRAIG